MLFNSAEFIFGFVPIVLFGFFWIASRFGNESAILWLVLSSLFFYGWWDPSYLLIILSSMVCNYHLGRHIYNRKCKWLLTAGVVGNLAVLGYFKYAGFLVFNLAWLTNSDWSIENIVLPLAISFFTFQQIAYLVDSYKQVTEEYRFIHYALFVTFFPQLIAGPIVHHKEMLPQFQSNNAFRVNANHIAIGISIFAIGLFKKTVIADGMADYANPVFNAADAGSAPDLLLAWSGILAYTFQIYFDFSGYSDMALGLARMFGIILPLNFYSPYKARSIAEFWRRWHITLSRFLRDYIYIPLGGNRKGQGYRYLFLMTTMLLGGLWHGAGWNFVIWGALHGGFLAVHQGWRLLSERHTWLQLHASIAWLITMLAVIVAWGFFRATSLDGALSILQGMVGLNGVAIPMAILARLGEVGVILQSWGVTGYHGGASHLVSAWIYCLLLIPVVVCLPTVQGLFRQHRASLTNIEETAGAGFWLAPRFIRKLAWQPALVWASFSSLLLVIGLMTLGQVSDFLYFQF